MDLRNLWIESIVLGQSMDCAGPMAQSMDCTSTTLHKIWILRKLSIISENVSSNSGLDE